MTIQKVFYQDTAFIDYVMRKEGELINKKKPL